MKQWKLVISPEMIEFHVKDCHSSFLDVQAQKCGKLHSQIELSELCLIVIFHSVAMLRTGSILESAIADAARSDSRGSWNTNHR